MVAQKTEIIKDEEFLQLEETSGQWKLTLITTSDNEVVT